MSCEGESPGSSTRRIRRFGFAIDVPKAIHLLDGYQGRDGGGVAEEDLRAVVDLARDEGILLDPVVTIKAFRGLLDTVGRDAKAWGSASASSTPAGRSVSSRFATG